MPAAVRYPSPRRALLPGVAASTAYLLMQAVDRRISGNEYDDRVLWGGWFPLDPQRQRLAGTVIHFGVGIGLAALYDALRPALPPLPGWLGGLLFAMAEHTLTFPSVIIGDLTHPSVLRGELPAFSTRQYFAVETARHATYGIVLGLTAREP